MHRDAVVRHDPETGVEEPECVGRKEILVDVQGSTTGLGLPKTAFGLFHPVSYLAEPVERGRGCREIAVNE